MSRVPLCLGCRDPVLLLAASALLLPVSLPIPDAHAQPAPSARPPPQAPRPARLQPAPALGGQPGDARRLNHGGGGGAERGAAQLALLQGPQPGGCGCHGCCCVGVMAMVWYVDAGSAEAAQFPSSCFACMLGRVDRQWLICASPPAVRHNTGLVNHQHLLCAQLPGAAARRARRPRPRAPLRAAARAGHRPLRLALLQPAHHAVAGG